MVEKKSNHQANVTRIDNIRNHDNADTLELINIGLYQVVVKKGEFKIGDFAVYIQPDSVVPQTAPFKFIWENYEGLDGKVPEKRRRITVRKFRKEWSEGLLLPVTDFPELWSKRYIGQESLFGAPAYKQYEPEDGDDVSDILGITHYDPDTGKETMEQNEKAPRKKRGPKSIKGWFYFILYKLFRYHREEIAVSGWDTKDGGIYAPTYDIQAMQHFATVFKDGEEIRITEKIHGSNARYVYLGEHMYAGSRTQWKSINSPCIWRRALKENPWIEEWCKAHEGYILYGEVTPTQGDDWRYGSDCTQFFAFDIYVPSSGKVQAVWLNPWDLSEGIRQKVPLLYRGPFSLDQVKYFVSGESVLYNGPREGIVVAPIVERHVHGLGRLKLKLVSPEFLAKDSK